MLRDLGVLGEEAIGLLGRIEIGDSTQLCRRDAGDPEGVEHGERAEPAADRYERDVFNRESLPGEKLVGPDLGLSEFLGHAARVDGARWGGGVNCRAVAHCVPGRTCHRARHTARSLGFDPEDVM